MTTTTAMPTSEIFTQVGARAIEAMTACAEASQRILRELVDLSATSAREGVRLYAELQSAAVDAVKDGQGALQDAARDPMAAYQQALLGSVEATQQGFKLVEGQAQAITRSAERLQGSAEHTAKEIQAAVGQLAGRVKSLYSPLA